MPTATTVVPDRVPVRPSRTVLAPVPLDRVRLRGGFWGERQEVNAAAILPHCEHWMERLGWVGNLERAAAGTIGAGHRGREFADSEVYKLVEAMAWQLAARPDPELERRLERLVDRIEAAQEEDGYLHTLFGRPGQRPRYSDFVWGHELYCFGHLVQAAVARARTSDDTRLLGVATRLADHVCREFGPEGRDQVCGHAEIEMALVELGRLTGEQRYTDQAELFVRRRGTGTLPLIEFGRAFAQDDVPVRDATVLRGHAVRALYLTAGAVDVAVETGDEELLAAVVAQVDATVATRTYVTGGMGSHHMDEAFGAPYVLPPDRSYCETCAGVATVMLTWRLLLATGEERFADLAERVLLNVVATSPSREGTAFFYANTLHQRERAQVPPLNEDGVAIRGGSSGREPWFEVSCCPPNVARTLAGLGGYLLTTTGDGVQLHQLAQLDARVELSEGGRQIGLAVRTGYPVDGRVEIAVVDTDGAELALSLRVPAWSQGATVTVGGDAERVGPGLHTVRRAFRPGDTVVLDLDMAPRWLFADPRVDAVRGCVAVQRGPVVLALESVDLPDGLDVDGVAVDVDAGLRVEDGRVVVRLARVDLTSSDWPYSEERSAGPERGTFDVPLVEYHDWAERGPSTMRIWIPRV